MKNIRFSLIATLVILSLINISCDPDEPTAPTKAEYISKSSWKFESATYNGAPVPAGYTVCLTDNTLTFYVTKYTVDEGMVFCVPSTATSGPQDWAFANNETQLVLATALVPGTTSGTFTLNTLNGTNLVISQNVIIPPATTPGPLVVTFKH
jgi:hypothetical protein